ncbi:MAG TPA: histidine ammonia-lyase [Steroidobacteraceae bacterium]|jgi:histidine ammonia-lyase|nr:histidine ammonia-lyase [Steroidobacteraceae bacterium]
MLQRILLDRPLSWGQVGDIAEGASLALSDGAQARIRAARALVESIVIKGVRAYGVNTGVGALCDVVIPESKQAQLSRNIVMSHAVGVGPALDSAAVRAVIAAAINNFAHGFSGVRPEVADGLLALLEHDCLPEVPALGSVGYLTHMAHIALVLIGAGTARSHGRTVSGADALRSIHLAPLVLGAKEGLSLVNGTPCATGLSALALRRTERLLDWADTVAAMSFENLRGQVAVFNADALHLRISAGVQSVGERLRAVLRGSAILDYSAGLRTQDALSLRAIPQVHGAVRDLFAHAARAVDDELASVTDNPAVAGTVEEPRALSGAHAVGAALGLTVDSLGIAVAEMAAMSERRLDRLVNPLLSNLPAFLATDDGAGSGFMIAQYTAVSLVADNRRLAAPASLDGGVTSALQEDHLSHATPGALKLHKIIDNAETIVAIELLAAAQAYELQRDSRARAPRTDEVYRRVRALVPQFRDDRPLSADIQSARELIQRHGS